MAEVLLLDDFIDFQLIGVNSYFETSFQFIFQINHTFGTGFQRIKDLDILINNQEFLFPTFYWYDSYNKIDYHIIKNRPIDIDIQNKGVDLSQLFQTKYPLISVYEDCNYIMKITGLEENIDKDELPIQTNDFINNIEIYDIDSISEASRLIF